MIPTFEEICERVGKHPKMVHGCYIFGSQVYGTADNHSDWDIMLIANSSVPELEHDDGRFNIHTVTPDKFKEWCDVNHIKAIECLLAPSQFQLKPFDYDFKFKEDSFSLELMGKVQEEVDAKRLLYRRQESFSLAKNSQFWDSICQDW
jgi:predicted nucleotidyltransferase